MTTEKPSYIPEFLGLLDAETASEQLTEGLLTGTENPRPIALSDLARPLPEEDRFRAEPVRALLDRAMHLCRNEKPTAADEWLAPRLHATLRLTRAEAADAELWSYLALVVAPDYVVWRHGGSGKVNADRFQGPHYKQTFARLWWAAELFRDGGDYLPAVLTCRNQDMLNTALRMDVMDHRPVAQSVAVLLSRGTVSTGREVNALCSVVNAAAMTLAYDVIAPDAERDANAVADWIRYETALRGDLVLPTGPAEPHVPKGSVDTLTELFADLFKDAPVRGRDQEADTAEAEEVTSS
ncbi:DUF6339 family protein [Streptomyces sp. BH106]|uniref:DUF6339 family protein n=1 Tax=Streptomyces sp. BH106 TaxID=3410409 RepID=UPI003CE69346